jgi:Zn finger protein HypA/HybF involved in hydrogenase expression
MHDFLLSKEIIDQLLEIIEEKKLESVKSVNLEIGAVSLAHDGFEEHEEDISLENLRFGLETASRDTVLEDAEFNITEIDGDDWKITGIEI